MSYLNGSLLFANIVGLQLLRLWQRSADRRPETDSWGKRLPPSHAAAADDDDNDDDDNNDNITLFTILTITVCKNIP